MASVIGTAKQLASSQCFHGSNGVMHAGTTYACNTSAYVGKCRLSLISNFSCSPFIPEAKV